MRTRASVYAQYELVVRETADDIALLGEGDEVDELVDGVRLRRASARTRRKIALHTVSWRPYDSFQSCVEAGCAEPPRRCAHRPTPSSMSPRLVVDLARHVPAQRLRPIGMSA
jgi:hypothetical protein